LDWEISHPKQGPKSEAFTFHRRNFTSQTRKASDKFTFGIKEKGMRNSYLKKGGNIGKFTIQTRTHE
jgi:hypothetical protein